MITCTRCGRAYPLNEALRWPRWCVEVDHLPEGYVGSVGATFSRRFECSAVALAQLGGEWRPDGAISDDVLAALSPVGGGEVVELGELLEWLRL